LEKAGYSYNDCWTGPPIAGRHVFECFPYTTLVGAEELGYDVERPRYKRPPRTLSAAAWRPLRAAACDDLLCRLVRLTDADPPLRLDSHPATAELLAESSPIRDNRLYKHREDLIDAALCAWTASLWHRHGFARCQVLGEQSRHGRSPTILAPARPEQRR
jgi:predicted RNase H-like nuclease